jgi:RNase P/RNase MRP subunit p29
MHIDELTHSNLGRFVNIIKSKNAKNLNKSGTIVNETKNMLYLDNPKSNSVIRIPKDEICEYEIYISNGTYILDGKRLLGRPEELPNILK